MICMTAQHDHTDRLARGPPLSWWICAPVIAALSYLSWAAVIEMIKAAFLFL